MGDLSVGDAERSVVFAPDGDIGPAYVYKMNGDRKIESWLGGKCEGIVAKFKYGPRFIIYFFGSLSHCSWRPFPRADTFPRAAPCVGSCGKKTRP